MRISRTAIARGCGYKWRWVSHLTPAERDAARHGETIIITDTAPVHGTHGSTLRAVKYLVGRRERYLHRPLTPEESIEFEHLLATNMDARAVGTKLLIDMEEESNDPGMSARHIE